jgi:gliding motility-associated lipoprotein GldD
MKKTAGLIISLFISILFFACQETYTPKPRAYFKVEFPNKEYHTFDSIYPFTFDCPVYAKVIPDAEKGADGNWMNIVFRDFNARIHTSYKPVVGNFAELEEDTRKLAYKHTVKADAIEEKIWNNETNKVYGILYDIQGNTASSIQFYLTDSTRHFLRGALYFNLKPNKDSLAPSIEFIRKDIDRMIESFKWKENSK